MRERGTSSTWPRSASRHELETINSLEGGVIRDDKGFRWGYTGFGLKVKGLDSLKVVYRVFFLQGINYRRY